MKIINIPLSQLVPSPANVRKTYSTAGIEGLAANIAAVGLLQNLQVQKAGNGKFEVVAGERRRRALNLRAKRKEIKKDEPIPCHVLTNEHAREVSLSENEMREAMHPADQFEAFKALIDAGQGPEEVAARFGVTAKTVQQRMKLADVSPKLFELYREGGIKLDQLMALTVSDDHAAQEAAWFDARGWQREPHAIRQRLTAEHVSDRDRRAQFVGVDGYVAAGGGVITDLFQSERYLTDPALLERLTAEKLEREADTVRAEGWQWVEIVAEIDFDLVRGFEELRGKREPLPAKQAKALAKLERQRDSMCDQDDLTDDEAARFEQLETEIATLSATAVTYSDRQKARAGAFVSIGANGKVDVVRGLIRPTDSKAKKRKDTDEREDGSSPSAAPGLSRALVDDLTTQRTAALRAVVSDRADIGLVLTVHALSVSVFYDEGDSVLALHVVTPALRAEGIDDSEAVKRLMQLRGIWATQLPEQPDALWDWLIEQKTDTLLTLLAHCVACTVKPERSTAADRLAAAVTLDMTQWWQPTAGYFGRLPKALILEAVADGKSGPSADTIATLKKGEMATKAAALLTGTGWLPAMLRAA
jgi:ParB family chromosome partitioning protein